MATKKKSSEVMEVESLAHTSLDDCYQCGKCTAGCPMGDEMDAGPHQVMRLVAAGHFEKAMRSESLWLCVSCLTCTTRCPKSCDPAAVIDALRQMGVEYDDMSDKQRRTIIFQKVFLQILNKFGRLSEIHLVGTFKVRGFLDDLSIPLLLKGSMLGPAMIARQKLHLLGGEKVKDRGVVKRIFERCLTDEDSKV